MAARVLIAIVSFTHSLTKLLIWAGFAIGSVTAGMLSISIFGDLGRDTTNLSNAAFAIVSAIAGLSLAYASTLDETNDFTPRFCLKNSGRTLIESAVLLLVSSITRYAAVSGQFGVIFATILSVMSTFMINVGTGYAILGLGTLLLGIIPIGELDPRGLLKQYDRLMEESRRRSRDRPLEGGNHSSGGRDGA